MTNLNLGETSKENLIGKIKKHGLRVVSGAQNQIMKVFQKKEGKAENTEPPKAVEKPIEFNEEELNTLKEIFSSKLPLHAKNQTRLKLAKQKLGTDDIGTPKYDKNGNHMAFTYFKDTKNHMIILNLNTGEITQIKTDLSLGIGDFFNYTNRLHYLEGIGFVVWNYNLSINRHGTRQEDMNHYKVIDLDGNEIDEGIASGLETMLKEIKLNFEKKIKEKQTQ